MELEDTCRRSCTPGITNETWARSSGCNIDWHLDKSRSEKGIDEIERGRCAIHVRSSPCPGVEHHDEHHKSGPKKLA